LRLDDVRDLRWPAEIASGAESLVFIFTAVEITLARPIDRILLAIRFLLAISASRLAFANS
jgi:hypothetical protein